MDEQPTERRRWPRHSVLVDCRIDGVAARTSVRLTELSIGGGYVDAKTTFQTGDPLALVMVLDGRELTVSSRVLYTIAGSGFGFGFDVDEMPPATRQRIAEFLRGHRQEDGVRS